MRNMDAGAVVLLLMTAVLLGGPLYVFLVKRTKPVPRDWSGRPSRGFAPTGDEPLDGE